MSLIRGNIPLEKTADRAQVLFDVVPVIIFQGPPAPNYRVTGEGRQAGDGSLRTRVLDNPIADDLERLRVECRFDRCVFLHFACAMPMNWKGCLPPGIGRSPR